jgi:hypothetical protein
MKIGDRVLWIDDMSEAWTVVGTNGYRVTVETPPHPRRARAKLTANISQFVPAPSGWRDCPPAPDPWNRLTQLMRTDDAFYKEVDEWEGKEIVWRLDHVRPLLARLQRNGK